MKPGALLRLPLPFIAAFTGLAAAPAPATPPPVGVSLGGAIGYDDNLYAVDAGPLAKLASGFAAASATISATPAAGASLAYAPTATVYFDEPREDHVKHVLSAAWKRKADALSWHAATEFAYVSGDERGVDYGAGCGNAFSTALPRERREQWQNKSELALRHDSAAGFVRGVGKLQYWDMLTTPVSGSNYVDRHDVFGGLDLGRALRAGGPDVYLGYRRGYQFQDRDAKPLSPRHASNHYHRYVAGLDGKLSDTLKISAQAGWARHAYPEDPAVYAGSAHEEGLFTDITLVWSVTASDELQLKTAQSRTVSTTGTNSYALAVHQLAWKHVFHRDWSSSLAGRVSEAEYAPFKRDDFAWALLGSLTWNIDANFSCTLSASREWGRDHNNTVTGPAADLRHFDRSLVSLGVTWKL